MAKSERRTSIACLAGVGVGVILFIAGLAWSLFGNARVLYTPEQAAEYAAASTALHGAKVATEPGSHGDASAASQAQVRFDRAKQALVAARFAEHGLGGWIMAGGLATALGFGVGYWSTRS